MTKLDNTTPPRGIPRACLALLALLLIAVLAITSTINKLSVYARADHQHSLRFEPHAASVGHTHESLLSLGEGALENPAEVYPEALHQVDWSARVSKRDVLHLGKLQRACTGHHDAVISWNYGEGSDTESTTSKLLGAGDDDALVVAALRQCATVDIYMPEGLRGQGYCEDAAAYAKYLEARLLPHWVFTRTFHDQANNRNVTYHQLCPKTPLLLFNHYWNGIRDQHDWPPTKPLYLMPNIEMYELRDTHYLQADLILCKTAVCATHLTKWLAQEGNPRRTQVLYTRFTSSDVATNALVSLGFEDTTDADGWPQRHKNFDDLVFTHTAGSSCHKGTQHVLDCWTSQPDLPKLNLYIRQDTYKTWYESSFARKIQASNNIQLHTGSLDDVSFGRMIADSAFFLCTSVMEGYGHYINHARAAGGLIITTDAPPMNELVTSWSGVVMNSTRSTRPEQYLGGLSGLPGALRDAPGFVAAFSGHTVCDAVDVVVRDLDREERRRRAYRARQQFFFDTAFFANKMAELRDTIRPPRTVVRR